MLVRHIRVPFHFIDKDNFSVETEYHPIATLVALDQQRIGLSVCSKHDNFAKKRGIAIAAARAEKEASPKEYYEDRRSFKYFNEDGSITEMHLSEIIDTELAYMKDRAERYFNNPEIEEAPKSKKKGFIRRLLTRNKL